MLKFPNGWDEAGRGTSRTLATASTTKARYQCSGLLIIALLLEPDHVELGLDVFERALCQHRMRNMQVRVRRQGTADIVARLFVFSKTVLDHPGVEEQPRIPGTQFHGLRNGHEGFFGPVVFI